MNVGRIWLVVNAFLMDSRLYLILGLIALDLVLGIAEACKRRAFDLKRVADFYMSNVIPGVIGYLALYVVFGYVAGLGTLLGQGLVTAAFAPLAAALAASVFGHLRFIGVRAGPTPESESDVVHERPFV